MARSAATYERELKELLQGDPAALRRYGRRFPPTARPSIHGHSRKPFLVVRAAGSHGFDLVALRPEFSFPIEVKSSAEETIRFSAAGGRGTEQWHEHQRAAARVDLFVIYAYRRLGRAPGDSWRLFATGEPPSGGLLRYLCRRFPPVEQTAEGHGILRWEHGLPLAEFLGQIGEITGSALPAGS